MEFDIFFSISQTPDTTGYTPSETEMYSNFFEQVELADELPCRVVVGEELKTHAGEIIGLFLGERIPQGIPPAEAARDID